MSTCAHVWLDLSMHTWRACTHMRLHVCAPVCTCVTVLCACEVLTSSTGDACLPQNLWSLGGPILQTLLSSPGRTSSPFTPIHIEGPCGHPGLSRAFGSACPQGGSSGVPMEDSSLCGDRGPVSTPSVVLPIPCPTDLQAEEPQPPPPSRLVAEAAHDQWSP